MILFQLKGQSLVAKQTKMTRIPKKQFDRWVMEAVGFIPQRFQKRMKNLVFVVDDQPSRLQIRECEHRRGSWLFGLYQGYEQTSKYRQMVTPDKISIFRKSFLGQYRSKYWMKIQVYKTVWHEVAHHFGSDENGAEKAEENMLGRYLRLKRTTRSKIRSRAQDVNSRRGYRRKSKISFRLG